jgi:hypothetical protein
MFYTQFQHPRLTQWQSRLARVPRWAWVAFFLGVILPLMVLGVTLLLVSVITGVIVMAAVLLIGSLVGSVFRMLHRRPNLDDGRRNVKIVVHSARIIDS